MLQTKAELVFDKARYELKQFIRFEARLLYKVILGGLPGSDENFTIFGGNLVRHPSINVSVDNSHLDVDCDTREPREVSEIVVTNDDRRDIFFRTEQGDELTPEEITLEELGAICDALQLTYDKKKLYFGN